MFFSIHQWLGVRISRSGRVVAASLAALIVAALPGCQGGDELARQSVSGQVKLDGKPLPSGSIQFLPGEAGGASVTGGTVIENGAYAIDGEMGLTPGKYKVSISSAQAGGAGPSSEAPGPATAPAKELVPAKYNVQSDLTADVKSGAANTFDFDLTSK